MNMAGVGSAYGSSETERGGIPLIAISASGEMRYIDPSEAPAGHVGQEASRQPVWQALRHMTVADIENRLRQTAGDRQQEC